MSMSDSDTSSQAIDYKYFRQITRDSESLLTLMFMFSIFTWIGFLDLLRVRYS